jgi:hypothetical protein
MQPVDPTIVTTFDQDAVFAKIYSSLALTGQKGPDGSGDLDGIDEGRSAFIRQMWSLNELTTDEAMCSWGDAEIPDMNYNKISSSHINVKALYARLYFDITLCNLFLTETKDISDAKTIRQRAETRFMRALNYFYLLDMYGNVGFIDVVSDVPAKQMLRADLYIWVLKELQECEGDMYAPTEAKSYYRVNRVANWMLRSRIYLNAKVYTGTEQLDSAAVLAKKIIDPSSGYSLCPIYRQLFMADNAGIVDGSTVNQAPKEIIFPIASDGFKTMGYGTTLFLIAATQAGDMPGRGITTPWAGIRSRGTLVKKFFPGNAVFSDNNDLTTSKSPTLSLKDSRALFLKGGVIIKKKDGSSDSINTVLRTMGSISNTFNEGYSVIKYSNLRADGVFSDGFITSTGQKMVNTDVPFMRQAEAYLTYAEAVTRGATPVGGLSALDAINTLRARAGKTTALTTLSLQNIIDEWAREFFFEGRRRTDLVRFGQYGGIGTGYTWEWKGGEVAGVDFSEDYNIFPIPSTEINANPNLTQNHGY